MLSSNILHGGRVRLTAVVKDDLPTITRWYEDTVFARLFEATPAMPKTEEQWSEWLQEQQKRKDNYLFAIRPEGNESLIGYAQLDEILWNHRTAWLAIGLGDRMNWGQGYGQEALALLLKFAFHELNLYRVQLTVFGYNDRAIALYEKMGFAREGVFRQFLERDGQRHDMILYGLLRDEWTAT